MQQVEATVRRDDARSAQLFTSQMSLQALDSFNPAASPFNQRLLFF
jgi:hypothetical protein